MHIFPSFHTPLSLSTFCSGPLGLFGRPRLRLVEVDLVLVLVLVVILVLVRVGDFVVIVIVAGCAGEREQVRRVSVTHLKRGPVEPLTEAQEVVDDLRENLLHEQLTDLRNIERDMLSRARLLSPVRSALGLTWNGSVSSANHQKKLPRSPSIPASSSSSSSPSGTLRLYLVSRLTSSDFHLISSFCSGGCKGSAGQAGAKHRQRTSGLRSSSASNSSISSEGPLSAPDPAALGSARTYFLVSLSLEKKGFSLKV